jgi:citrate synthase
MLMRDAEDQRFLSARQAARLLGVKPATLYAYVSRGLLESVPAANGRARRYRRADLDRLRAEGRRAGASAALRWGEPVLDSAITAMTQQGPEYRGRNALALAAADTPFEAVAELLWSGVLPPGRPAWPAGAAELAGLGALLPEHPPPAAVHALAVAALAARDEGRVDLRTESVLDRARRLIRTLAASLAWTRPGAGARGVREALAATSVAESLALALGAPPRARAIAALDRMLVLLADHELNVSTFAARVAASAHADPYGAVLAGVAALSGPRHGGATDRVEALLAEVEAAGHAARVLHERERRGELVPGFGHPFYPGGDPRAALLLETARALGARTRSAAAAFAVVEAAAAAGKPPPNVDAAIVALRASLGLPRGAGAGLFAVGRCAGWIAHVLEQYAAGFLFRPRARYLGAEFAAQE